PDVPDVVLAPSPDAAADPAAEPGAEPAPDHDNARRGPDPGSLELTHAERKSFSALVRWSCADELFAAEGSLAKDEAFLVLRGEIDALALPRLQAVLDSVEEARPHLLLIDLSGAVFVSVSAMLRMVDSARHIPQVAIVRPSATVRRIFELADCDGRVEVRG
ncbi:MAG: STAS domain-containing protein, partial [Acidimicrobiales bacterium]